MKHLFTVLLLLLASDQIHASLRQTQYRWRNDDGDETTATWMAAANTPVEVNDLSAVIRLRMEFDNDNGFGEYSELSQTLQYSSNGGGTWTTINNNTNNAFVYVSSAFVADGTPATNQMAGTGGSYVAGKIISAVPSGPWLNLYDAQKTEYEWVIQPTANILPSATYIFQVPDLESGSVYTPTLNTNCLGGGIVISVASVTEGSTCGSGSVALQATPSPASATINWYDSPTGGSLLSTGNVYNTPVISSTTTYYVSASNACAESERVPVTATVNSAGSVVNLGSDYSFCESTLINAGSFSAYLWDDGSTGSTRTVYTSGTYYVTVTNELGCNSSDTVVLTANPVPVVDLGPFEALCLPPGESITLDAGNPGSTFLWNDASTGQTNSVYESGTYSVTVTNEFGCQASDTVTKTISVSPFVDIGPSDTIICNGMTLTLSADAGGQGNVSYSWNTGSTDADISVTNAGQYFVVVSNNAGCTNSDTINVTVSSDLPSIDAILVTNQGPYSFRFETYNLQGAIDQHSWDFGDGTPVSHALSPTHTYSAPGNYTVTLTLKTSNCGLIHYETSVHIVGLNDIIVDGALINIYPNPVRDILTIENKSNLTIEDIAVMDIRGGVIHKEKHHAALIYKLDVSEYANGLYFIRLNTNRGAVIRKFEVLK